MAPTMLAIFVLPSSVACLASLDSALTWLALSALSLVWEDIWLIELEISSREAADSVAPWDRDWAESLTLVLPLEICSPAV
jgi:hypothetical protein